MANVRFYKVNALPAEPAQADALYLVQSGDEAEFFVTDSSGNFKDVGNTTMITAVVNSLKAIANGIASLDGNAKVPVSQLPDAAPGLLRDNYVVVKQLSDLPAAAGGVITLDANTLYEINGLIATSDMIDLNNAVIVGLDIHQDGLNYTGVSNQLFTGTRGGVVKSLTLNAGSAKVFSLDDTGGGDQELIIQDVIIKDVSDAGDIKAYANLLIRNLKMVNVTTGFVLTDIDNLSIIGTHVAADCAGTILDLNGTFDNIHISGGEINVQGGATGINIAGVTTINFRAVIGAINLVGAGTLLTGTIAKEWDIITPQVLNSDYFSHAALYINASAPTEVATINTPFIVAGTTAAITSSRFTIDPSRLIYAGKVQVIKRVTATISVQATGAAGGKTYSFYIAKNGAIVPDSRQQIVIPDGTQISEITVSTLVQFSNGDYVEVFVENNTDTTNVTALFMNLGVQ